MSALHKIIMSSLVLLCLVACSEDESSEEVLFRLDENGVVFSPTDMSGGTRYLPSMKADRFRIVRVDNKLNPLDSFDVPADHEDWYPNSFSVGTRDYEFPYVKIVTVFPLDGDDEMEFPQYYRIEKYNNGIELHIYGALISGRVETLVQKEKYSLNDAIEKAYGELKKTLGIDIDFPENRSFYQSKKDSYYSDYVELRDLFPYVLCRHEISDSLFYSDFMELRDSFAKDGTLDDSIKVRAADSWLATFLLPSGTMEWYDFESVNRDTSSGLTDIDTAFFNWAYELNRSWNQKDSIEIKTELSRYNGRMFVYESYSGGWRLQTAIEDTLGTCLYYGWNFAEHDGAAYLCRYQSFYWEKLSNIDSVLNHKYTECQRDYWSYGSLGYFNDTMYVCDCDDSDKCGWSVVNKDFKGTVLDTPTVNILATLRYGDCRELVDAKEVMDDSIMVRCYGNRWLKVDTLSYYMGICNNGSNEMEYAQMPNGDYYKCRTYGGKEWEPSTYPEAKGHMCDWYTPNYYEKNDDKYFYCKNNWVEVPVDSVIRPVVDEEPCDSAHLDEAKIYDDEIFICDMYEKSGKKLYYWMKSKEND